MYRLINEAHTYLLDLRTYSQIPVIEDNRDWLEARKFLIEKGCYVNDEFLPDGNNLLDWERPPIPDAKKTAELDIDKAAYSTRNLFKSPGKDSTYIMKYLQTRDYVAAGSPVDLTNWPYIAAEVIRLEGNPVDWPRELKQQAAEGILATAAQWVQIDAEIETITLSGKVKMRNETTYEGIRAVVTSVSSQLSSLASSLQN